MISLRKLFGKDDRFFNLLEASAEAGQASVHSACQLLRHPHQEQRRDQVLQARRQDKEIHEEISTHVIRSFVTSLDREDIEALSTALHRIPKTAEKIAARFELCHKELAGYDFAAYADLLEKIVAHVCGLVGQLRRGTNIEHVEAHTTDLQQMERQANQYLLALIQAVHAKPNEMREMIVLRDLCRFLERLVDRCVEAGEVITQIVLKNT